MRSPPAPLRINAAVNVLHQGGVIACPTEAVWGLSCNPEDEYAVQRLLLLKNRPVSKGLILVAASADQLDCLLADLPPTQQQILANTWPGPVTWLVPHHNKVPGWVCGEHNTVAVRVSAHPTVAALCNAFGGPLVSTSANPAAALPAREQFQVHRYFHGQLDYVMPGRVGTSKQPSSIRDLVSGKRIR